MSTESVIPSNHLILSSPSPPDFNLSQHQGLFQWLGSSHQVAKVLELQLQHQCFQWIFRVDFLYDQLLWSLCSLRDSQEPSPAPQFKSINSSALNLLQLWHPYMTTKKTHTFDCITEQAHFLEVFACGSAWNIIAIQFLFADWKTPWPLGKMGWWYRNGTIVSQKEDEDFYTHVPSAVWSECPILCNKIEISHLFKKMKWNFSG